ncbi:hypothetical protein [Streptomyces parvus]|uniref:hypothetical protein n=1 Tax=Streptomyces parvus TaxID=66428 RepID=UPI003557A53C
MPLSPGDAATVRLITGDRVALTRGPQLSRRTVQRRIQNLMERSDAATRMQLARRAARRGWL